MRIMTKRPVCPCGGRFENAWFWRDFGTRQSSSEFQVADIIEDFPILEEAEEWLSFISSIEGWQRIRVAHDCPPSGKKNI